MLTRRDIRIKVMQALYAFMQSDNNRLDLAEKKLLESIDKIYHLFIWQLSFICEVAEFAQRRIDENRQKHLPTAEDLSPNTRFVSNNLIRGIAENRNYLALRQQHKINWGLQEELIRKFYNELRDSEPYREYMAKPSITFADDQEIVLFMLREMMVQFELLLYFFEEMDIHWVDDYDTVLILVERTLKGWKENQAPATKLPELIRTGITGEQEDRTFARELFSKVLLNGKRYDTVIEEKISNWEFDRVARVDIILLRMAVCEFLEFPSIPVKVTINEYIDISKIFSSPKSKQFINGMLDKLAIHFREEGALLKTGRGLIDK